MRGSRASCTEPKPGAPKVVFRSLNCVWLKMLYISARNCHLAVSPRKRPPYHFIPKFLIMEKSQLLIPGRRILFFPTFPRVPAAGDENALMLNHCSAVFGPVLGS